MRGVVILCILTMTVVATVGQDKYSDKYDSINLDEVLDNERLLGSYLQCLLEVRPKRCTPAGRALKSHLAEALATDCTRCTNKQRIGAEKVIKYLLANMPDDWMKLVTKFNPSGEFLWKHPNLSA